MTTLVARAQLTGNSDRMTTCVARAQLTGRRCRMTTVVARAQLTVRPLVFILAAAALTFTSYGTCLIYQWLLPRFARFLDRQVGTPVVSSCDEDRSRLSRHLAIRSSHCALGTRRIALPDPSDPPLPTLPLTLLGPSVLFFFSLFKAQWA